ncbi:MAG: SpoIIE family protein phosphatase [Scytolyngbya sp. HA4215-MV1]|nr:SpoIIE family protein phosphatase [Scytolyngbya sp. HA4215-MV1]
MKRGTESKLRLMVVDDEPDNLDLLYRTFRRDFEVFRADSALKALEILAQQGEMAIIISDQRMPEMLGTEFLSRTVDPYPDTIRIVLTGYTDVEDLVEAINSGKVFKYITKPWSPDSLKAVVQQAAETYRVIKQRTHELRRTLRRESIFNAVMTAIRGSLDYASMLQTIAATLGQTFEANHCILRPVENNALVPELFQYHAVAVSAANGSVDLLLDVLKHDPLVTIVLERCQMQTAHSIDEGQSLIKLVVPLTYQQDFLAILGLYRSGEASPWTKSDVELIEGVAEQAALAISQAKLYQRTQLQAEQMRAELAVARQIQGNLLRQSMPDLDGVKVQACCYPAREVGGDFFEVYAHPQGDIWLAVGDVSGKGVPAALFMASAISVLRRELSQETSPEPDVLMKNLNSILSEELISTNCFITMVLARYTPSSRKLVYANAGHIYPLVWSSLAVVAQAEGGDGVEPNYLKVRGVPLGILPNWKAAAGTLELNPGEILLLTSDGITEATIVGTDLADTSGKSPPIANAMLQQKGLWQLLLQEQQSLDLDHLLARIRAHNVVQEDDQTLLSLEVL